VDRDFLTAVAGAAAGQNAGDLVAQGEAVLPQHNRTVEERLAQGTHTAEIDGSAHDDASHLGGLQPRCELGEVVLVALGTGDPGGEITVDPKVRQLD